MKTHFLEEMTWRDAEAIRRETDIAIVPVGSIEVHGPHLLLGCDTFVAQALAKEVTERVGGVVTPPISMTYSGGTKPFTGTISIPLPLMAQYIKAVCVAMLEQGFKRTMIVEWHAPYTAAQMVSRELFEELGAPVLLYAPCIRPESMREAFDDEDGPAIEGSLLLGALKLLGKEEKLDLSGIKKHVQSKPRPSFIQAIGSTGAWFGHYYDDETQHQPPRAGCSAEKGIKAIKHSAERIASIVGDWAKYAEYAAERHEKGWRVTE